MKKTTRNILVALLALFIASPAMAQQFVDVAQATVSGYSHQTQDLSKLPKMEKDIVILQNVLGDLFSDSENSFYSSRSAKGMYIPGSGVIFSMGNSFYGRVFLDVLRGKTEDDGSEKADELSAEEMNKQNADRLRKLSKEFLANYGSLLTELKPGEKIMLNLDYTDIITEEKVNTSANRISYARPTTQKKRMQSSISQKTLSDFTSGKLSLEQAMNAIEVKVNEDVEKEMTDAKILAGILDDLLQSSMDGKFRRRGRTNWTYFDGFGLMFNIQLSTSVSGNVAILSQTIGSGTRVVSKNSEDKQKEIEEAMKAVEEAYPDFENMLKENVIQYGRTLRSLGSNESVIINVDLGSAYRNANIPRSIRMVIPKSTIDAYAKGQKSLDQVKNEIDVTKMQTSLSGSSHLWSVQDVDFFPTVIEAVPSPPAPLKGAVGTSSKSNR
ncbi:hypothetical protein [Roseivirga thermotolerans]|uniref:Peptidase n=1 Tax=Roseivirga thermotolerans TaxID=1758176 RepID=A0ABQ3IAP2_9BACT|nr:hypothetical protein [Roseivirga thermotolerans]GHE70348.1 hypothetical protein GCM10011340_27510 [Roseivirga thermotolerans]